MAVEADVLDLVVGEEYFPDKAVIVKEGGSGEWIYVILEGRVKIQKRTAKGMLTLDNLSEGDFIGESALLHHGKRPRVVSAVADGPVQVGTLDTAQLIREWDQQPVRLRKLMANLMGNLEEATAQLVSRVEGR